MNGNELYNDDCRYFVQYMLKNGCVSEQKAVSFISQVNAEINDSNGLKRLASLINEEVALDGFKIVFAQCEVTEANLVMWLNLKNDKYSQLQTTYTPLQLLYFHEIMTEIIKCEEHRLAYNICLYLTNQLPNPLSKNDACDLLEQWIKGGYFVKSDIHVYLGARCIHEYDSFFRQNYADQLKTCNLCSETVFVGSMCSICGTEFHRMCLHKFLQKQNKCPKCKQAWSEAETNGDAVFMEADDSDEC